MYQLPYDCARCAGPLDACPSAMQCARFTSSWCKHRQAVTDFIKTIPQGGDRCPDFVTNEDQTI